MKLPVAVDCDRLLQDYAAIPADVWSRSHWDEHCSTDMLLLRGGTSGTEDDFLAAEVSDGEILGQLPYIAWLIGDRGPFGPACYAFLFRMKPNGVARPHTDAAEAWKAPLRIHIPITTNDGAFLLSERRSQHFAVGEAWTFDNQAEHAVVNGNAVRTHLIFDVAPNPRLDRLLADAEYVAGKEDPERWTRTLLPKPPPIFVPASMEALSPMEKRALRLDATGFATRVRRVRRLARIMGCPLKDGDIIVSIDGVTDCPVSRTASAYLRFHGEVGKPNILGVLRRGTPLTVSMKPRADFTKSQLWRKLASLRSRLLSPTR